MIFNYDSFLESLILSQINEAVLYYSPDLLKYLKKLSKDSDIAKDLLSIETQDVKPDTTFIDLDKDGYLSFITSSNAIRLIDAKWPDGNVSSILKDKPNKGMFDLIWKADKEGGDDVSGVSTKSRNLIKIGKLVNKLFPNKYKDKDIEEFVNKFKAAIDNSKEKFMVVEGDDIDFWYNSDNYYENSGSLGNSCMKGKSGRGYFDIYTKNPEVCQMLVLVEDDKLKGRALVWKVKTTEQSFEYFLDRQYTINDSDVVKFRNYAKEKGWAYKTYNNHSNFGSVTFEDTDKKIEMSVQLNKQKYDRFPYVDTFRRYDPDTGILYNDDSQDPENKGQYILEDTGGGYIRIEGGKWSEYYGDYIDEDRAVWSDPMGSYLDIEESVEVERGSRRNRGWWPRDHDEIYYDEYMGDFIHEDDSIYSSYYGHRILAEDAVMIISGFRKFPNYAQTTYIYDDDNDNWISTREIGDMLWYQKIQSEDPNKDWDDIRGVLSELLMDTKIGWIPEDIQIDIYKAAENEYGIDYASRVDAYILGIKLNIEDRKMVDMVYYDTTLSKIKYENRELVKMMINKGKDLVNDKQLSLFAKDDVTMHRLREVFSRVATLTERRYILED